jgi:putative peptidoglycan lipid II flippase
VLVALGIFVSRVAGLVREAVFNHYFGLSAYADVFRAALRLPNLVQNLLGEGTLSASFIPVYARLNAEGRTDEARRLAGTVLAGLTALAAVAVLVGELLAPWIVAIFLPGFEGVRYDATVDAVRVLFPMTGVLVVSAWALGILNSHRTFFLPYVAPVMWNVAIVAALVVGGEALGLDARAHVLFTAWGALVGALLQLAVQVPTVLRLVPGVRPAWATSDAGVREVVRTAGPAVFGRGVVQIGGYLDQVLASWLATGAVAAIGSAQILYMLPISLFGMAVAAAELPEMASARADVLVGRVRSATARVAYFVVPSVAMFFVAGDTIVGALFERGAFTATDSRVVWWVLGGYSVGLLASATSRTLSSASYALGDSKAPARAATVRVISSAVLGLVFMASLEPIPGLGWATAPLAGWTVDGRPLGAAGVTLGTGVAAWMEWWLLRRSLAARLGAIGLGAGAWVRLIGVAALAGTAAAFVRALVAGVHPMIAVVPVVGAFALVWGAGTFALGVPEARALAARLTRRRR